MKTQNFALTIKTFTTLLLFLIGTAGLTQSSKFYGTSKMSGLKKAGGIFKTDSNGINYVLLDSFDVKQDGNGIHAQKMIQASNGKIYGTTNSGGKYNFGTLFKYNPTNDSLMTVYHFKDSIGKKPSGSLLLSNNGKIYGTTINGGTYNNGTLFEFNPLTNVIIRKKNFSHTSYGKYPHGRMTEVSGSIYGVCYSGGASNHGTLFKYEISTNILSLKKSFNDTVDGKLPIGLIKATNGKLYGMTYYGGQYSKGILFEYDITANLLTRKISFNGTGNGANPYQDNNLYEETPGIFYGLTCRGGTANSGIIFKYELATNTLTKKQDFAYYRKYAYPYGSFTASSAGKLIATMTGGMNTMLPNHLRGSGSIIEYTISTNTVTAKKYTHKVEHGGSVNSTLLKASNGKYYGGSFYGGIGNAGTLFEYDLTLDTFLKKYDFSVSPNGSNPIEGMIQASNGKMYGITESGGIGYGVIFEFNPTNNKITKLVSLSKNIGQSRHKLIQANNGKIYGIASTGGTFKEGSIFEYDINTSTLTLKVNFKGTLTDGKYPRINLIKANNGNLYGATSAGGQNYRGSIFEYNVSLDTILYLSPFNNSTNGNNPKSLIQATNGKFYGVNYGGGTNNKGTLFEYNRTIDTITVLRDFNDTIGSAPSESLLQASNGKIYGTTRRGNSSGASSGKGVLFEYDIVSDSMKVKVNLTPLNSYGITPMMEASNGNIYYSNKYISSRINEYIIGDTLTTIKTIKNGVIISGILLEVITPNIGIVENSYINKNFYLYPNPTSTKLTLDVKEDINQLKVWTISGKLVLETVPNTKTIDVSRLENGMYIIQIATDNGIKTSRFVKR